MLIFIFSILQIESDTSIKVPVLHLARLIQNATDRQNKSSKVFLYSYEYENENTFQSVFYQVFGKTLRKLAHAIYTPQNIPRATILFSIYHNVKLPKLNPTLVDIPKEAEWPILGIVPKYLTTRQLKKKTP